MAAPTRPPDRSQRKAIRAVPVRHPGRWVAAAVVLVLGVMFVHTLFATQVVRGGQRQPRFEWEVIRRYLWSRPVLDGVIITVELTAIAMAIGVVLGIVLAVMRLSPNPIVSSASWLYIWFFRGTPVLVQLLFWYDLSYLYPALSLGIPFGPAFLHLNANTVVTPFAAALFGLGLNEGAYMAEIVRAGILSVDEGQTDAAKALGLTRLSTMRRIVLPQAMRVIIPPMGNETISMLKTSSLASTITVVELLRSAQNIYSRTFQTVPLLMVASFWYLAMTSVLTVGQYYLERRFARGARRQPPPSPIQRIRHWLRRAYASRTEPPGVPGVPGPGR
ncbi:MAG: polar amino acid transport system permease protein [Acidimicrobiaceae bacterium]|jgi:polar amino acid transport system permease protein|nr:polar amino acid transport system permease protein [Acidimicrobiaceae bacterium]